ncbi:hypothetical protein Q5424_26565 [Conexibacter sp. JD483]|uniref:DUF6916 family protein n=1 Tax=unclassified Conexibacter TaxID=2627773 RepID=UPI0027260F06|nr:MULTISPECIES: hypothetical protein [unclassified Conexibacter]MDO8189397.1 hypothetical protein [Conexibacter sp. CPCC 205706]MDO8202046.1 hypothetical protein [Conexibacter sp. CPCC 205762]MDR9372691.1 hypothetical protein [Conexibacter sp. JD483]
MSDLAQLTLEQFAPHVGDTFALTLTATDGAETLELAFTLDAAVEVAGAGDDAARQPFALRFRVPFATVLPQQIFPLRHERLGTLEIFLVPIGQDADGVRYEAVFA